MSRYTKDPNAVLDYSVNWSAWLPANDTIAASAWTVMSDAVDAVAIEDTSFNDTTTTRLALRRRSRPEVHRHQPHQHQRRPPGRPLADHHLQGTVVSQPIVMGLQIWAEAEVQKADTVTTTTSEEGTPQ